MNRKINNNEFVKMFTPREVANILRIAYTTVLDLIKLGRLNAFQVGKHYRISKDELSNYIKENQYNSYWKDKEL